MKKLLTILALALATASAAHAQFGVIGGFTRSNTAINTQDWKANVTGVNLFHAGLAYKLELGNFLALQPAIAYQMKGSAITDEQLNVSGLQSVAASLNSKTGYVEASLGLQGGVDLLAFRPFVLVEPFVGYAVTGTENFAAVGSGIITGSTSSEDLNAAIADVKNKLEYGFGIGGGVELLDHIQVSVQWFMNLGSLYDGDKIDAESKMAAVKAQYKDVKNYQGIKVTLGLFF